MLELHAIFRGQVQGVGFRWTIADYAEQHSLTGTVQNLLDGTVEVVAQGPKVSLEAFLAAVKSNPGHARITSLKTTYHQPTLSFSNFRIH